MSKDFYKTLGVEKGADAAEIKKSYRKQAMKYHPDQNKDDKEAEAKFKEINAAYDVLKDDEKRAAYDRFGAAAFDGSMGGGGGGGGGNPFSGGFQGGFGGANFSDIFEDMFGDVMGGGRRGGGAMRGADMQYAMEITLEDAFKGKGETITVPLNDTCDGCKGTGAEKGKKPETCSTCKGAASCPRAARIFLLLNEPVQPAAVMVKLLKSRVKNVPAPDGCAVKKRLKLIFPKALIPGAAFAYPVKGEAGVRGGPAGDLYVLISVKPHKFFKRDGANLHCRVPIAMTTATLGGEIEVPTIGGKRSKVKIPGGTQTGQQFRLKEQGMPVIQSAGTGDMYIEIFVETPVNLNTKQKEAFKKLDADFSGKDGKKYSPESSSFVSRMKDLWSDLTE